MRAYEDVKYSSIHQKSHAVSSGFGGAHHDPEDDTEVLRAPGPQEIVGCACLSTLRLIHFWQEFAPIRRRLVGLVPTSRHRAGKCRISDVCGISLISIPENGNIEGVKVFGEAVISSRKPLQRFVTIARTALWPHFPAVKETFPNTDYAPATRTLIFNVGGNKYRLIARVDFEEQLLAIQTV